MDLEFLTPTQVWEGFNPVKEPLQPSLSNSVERGDVSVSELFFTAESAPDGKVRAFCRTLYKKSGAQKKPALIVLPSLVPEFFDDEVITTLVEEDYAVIILDYAGIYADGPKTSFPKSLEFAQAENALANPRYMDKSARNTPWFVWAKICRRAITMASELLYVDRDSIGVIGKNEGAQLAWILAGIEGRIKTAVPLLGGGYLFHDDLKAADGEKSEEQRVWTAGVGAETYARAVSCPLYFATSSNNANFDVDRAGDILDYIPVKAKALSISPRTNSQLTLECFKGVLAWLRAFLKASGGDVPTQTVEFENLDGELFLRCRQSVKAKNSVAYVSWNEKHSAARDWHTLEPYMTDSQTGDVLFKVEIYDYSERVSAFVNSKFENNLVISSPILEAVPEKLKITAPVLLRAESSRIIYDNTHGLTSSAIESDSLVLDENMLQLREGPHHIVGLTTAAGRLVSYKLAKSPLSAKKDIILQLDAYSKEPRTITLSLLNFADKKSYTASRQLSGGEIWQRVSFVASDFKTRDQKPLQTFSEIEKACFLNAEGVLFNNIIWL